MRPAKKSTFDTARGPTHERTHQTGQRGSVACAATGCVNVGDTERVLSGFGGSASAGAARLLGEAPEQQIADDLREFKRRMDAGGATPAGQASSARSGATTVSGR